MTVHSGFIALSRLQQVLERWWLMSNVEARVARTLSQPGHKQFALGGQARAGWPLPRGSGRRRLGAALLFAGDLMSGAIIMVGGAAMVDQVWPGHRAALIGGPSMQIFLLLLLLLGISGALGVYRSNIRSPMERFRVRVTATLLFVFAGILMWVRESSAIELAIVPLMGGAVLVLGLWVEHAIALGAQLTRSHVFRSPTAILGTGPRSRALADLLLSRPSSGLHPVGFIDDGTGQSTQADRSAGPAAALPVLGSLEEWHGDSSLDVVVVPDSGLLPRDPAALYRLGARQVLLVTQVGEFPTFGLQVRNAGCFDALELSARASYPHEGVKRAIDVVVALAFLALAAPIIAVFAGAIKLADPGPAFYGQWRVGRYGRPIRILKLRTMYVDAEQRLERVLASDPALREHWQRYFKLAQDPRILPCIGHLMRRASIDELPQLWNVVRGDMSLVGPRPFPAYHLDAFDPEFRALRATVSPGLTGLWQISSRSDGDLDVQRAEDCLYIKNRSLWLDLYILIATLPAVVGSPGAK